MSILASLVSSHLVLETPHRKSVRLVVDVLTQIRDVVVQATVVRERRIVLCGLPEVRDVAALVEPATVVAVARGQAREAGRIAVVGSDVIPVREGGVIEFHRSTNVNLSAT